MDDGKVLGAKLDPGVSLDAPCSGSNRDQPSFIALFMVAVLLLAGVGAVSADGVAFEGRPMAPALVGFQDRALAAVRARSNLRILRTTLVR
jgi:hypothetical protein